MKSDSSSGMRPRKREPAVNWMMVFVVAVVVFGVFLLVTGKLAGA